MDKVFPKSYGTTISPEILAGYLQNNGSQSFNGNFSVSGTFDLYGNFRQWGSQHYISASVTASDRIEVDNYGPDQAAYINQNGTGDIADFTKNDVVQFVILNNGTVEAKQSAGFSGSFKAMAGADVTGSVNINSGSFYTSGRILGSQSSDINSANDLVLGSGNYFHILGNTTINRILGTGWTTGSEISIETDSDLTIVHGVATSTGFNGIQCQGSQNISSSAGFILRLRNTGTTWRDIYRSGL